MGINGARLLNQHSPTAVTLTKLVQKALLLCAGVYISEISNDGAHLSTHASYGVGFIVLGFWMWVR